MTKNQIIKLDATNIDEIYNLFLEAFGNESWTKQQLLSSLNNTCSAFYAVLVEKKIVSIISVLNAVDDINILDIATKNEYKKMGFASMLIDYIKSIKQPNQTISLEVKESNYPAINLYAKHGFKTISKRKKYYKNGESANVMFFGLNHEQ